MKNLLIFLTIIILVFFFSTISSSVSTDSSTIISAPQQIPKVKTTVKADTISIKLARRGCCSHHGGVYGCDEPNGMIRYNDGTLSPTCTSAEY